MGGGRGVPVRVGVGVSQNHNTVPLCLTVSQFKALLCKREEVNIKKSELSAKQTPLFRHVTKKPSDLEVILNCIKIAILFLFISVTQTQPFLA